ncbi:exodeoxyribonuclease III [uncultured Cetobacterium sp.]|uniref:exodeoxyribonuclease III n=1 Tax=uncultured Cetobacterium sp. TaxID=527638 RepID=UPI0026249177|nr:exodeoxyribonuclease III [uncultured Cetobacterium sp.]
MKKMISWNVNGLRAILQKNFNEYFNEVNADIFCLQEIKLQEGQIDLNPEGYYSYWNYAIKKGYSGTAIFTKEKPLSVTYGLNIEKHDTEGRVITLEFDNFYFLTVYTPNSQSKLARIDYRMEWENDFREYLLQLNLKKPVIICGDLNVAHTEIDLKNPKSNKNNAGFSQQERDKFTELLNSGFTDTFRFKHPNDIEKYSWWSYRFNARSNNAGWRIDYFITSNSIKNLIAEANIHNEVLGSDHCPVELIINI